MTSGLTQPVFGLKRIGNLMVKDGKLFHQLYFIFNFDPHAGIYSATQEPFEP